jgi:hypothetical protein
MKKSFQKNKTKVVRKIPFSNPSVVIASIASAMIALIVFLVAFDNDQFVSLALQKNIAGTALTHRADASAASNPSVNSQSWALSANPFGSTTCRRPVVDPQSDTDCLGNTNDTDNDRLTLLAYESHFLAGRRELVEEIAGLHNSCVLARILDPRVVLKDQCSLTNLERSKKLIRSTLHAAMKNNEDSAEKAYVVWLNRNLDLPEIQLRLLEIANDAERSAIDKQYNDASLLKESYKKQAAELLEFLESKKKLNQEEEILYNKIRDKLEKY